MASPIASSKPWRERSSELDDAERTHLFDLARAARPSGSLPRRRRASRQQVRPSVQRVLDGITGAAALVRNDRLDILAANTLDRALYSEIFAGPWIPANAARYIFLDPRSQEFYPA
jgi:MmyB-like transcription regulator ligand binding domain